MAGASAVGVSRSGAPLLQLDARPITRVGLLGLFERGPIGVATEIASYPEFQRIFGGFTASAQQGPLGAKLTFEESRDPEQPSATANVILEVVRVVHSSTPADISTKTSAAAHVDLATAAVAPTAATVASSVGPWALPNGATLVVAFEAGGDQTFTIQCTPALITGSGATYDPVTALHTLTLTLAGQQFQVAFTGSEADQAAFHNTINAVIAGHGAATNQGGQTRITTAKKGEDITGSIDAGDADVLASLGLAVGAFTNAGPNNVADNSDIQAAEWVTIAAAITNGTVEDDDGALRFTSAATGDSSSAQVKASSTADTLMGFSNTASTGSDAAAVDTLRIAASSDGEWANAYSVRIAAASNGDAGRFNLQLLKGGIIVETFINLTMDDADPLYVETAINQGVGSQSASIYMVATDLDAGVDDPPATGTFDLDGDVSGSDGLSGLVDADFVGGLNAAGKTAGLSAFDRVPLIDVFLTPDRTTSSFHNSLNSYNNGRQFPAHIEFEPPAGLSPTQIRAYVKSTAQLYGLTERGSIQWPRTYVDNPDVSVFGNAVTVLGPISAQVAGLYARVDASRIGGASISPAGTTLRLYTARALENDDVRDPTIRGRVFDDLINPVTVVEVGDNAGAIYVDGARCLKSDGPFPYKGQSRGVGFLERQLGIALDPQRHKNLTEALRAAIAGKGGEIESFLKLLADNDFFASKVYAQAFRLNGGSALNPLSEQRAGRGNISLGVAMAYPGEFWNLNFYPFSA